ncbi:REP-associated tyrosine transposase [Celerinatantimonas sp. MCCC 1A17872]|uniref:REP-associated tyrosine transposase n=1 Tax=Celerinatantimonas sp. MCCC 1A17872 TaxID=3177514 RepID=UPI0038C16D5A
MVSYRRAYQPNGCYWLSLRQVDCSRSYFLDNIKLLEKSVTDSLCRHPGIMQAMVVLPNQLQMMILFPFDDDRHSSFVRMLKRQFSNHLSNICAIRSFNPKQLQSVWQDGFECSLMNDSLQWQHCIDQLHYAPVRLGLVNDVKSWQYSSFHQYVQEGILESDWPNSAQAEPRHVEIMPDFSLWRFNPNY